MVLFFFFFRGRKTRRRQKNSLSLSLPQRAIRFWRDAIGNWTRRDAPQNAPRLLFERDKKAPSQFLNPKQKKAKIKTLNMRHTSLSLYFSLLFFFFFFSSTQNKKRDDIFHRRQSFPFLTKVYNTFPTLFFSRGDLETSSPSSWCCCC